MEPKIVEKNEFKVVGMTYYGNNSNGEISSQLWCTFNKRENEIKSRTNNIVCYGVCESEITPDGKFYYTACTEVNDFEAVPEGMVTKVIPASKYLVFTFKDKLEKLGDFYNYIYKTYLPSSNYELVKTPDFEYYDQRFCDNGEFDIYIPIK